MRKSSSVYMTKVMFLSTLIQGKQPKIINKLIVQAKKRVSRAKLSPTILMQIPQTILVKTGNRGTSDKT